MEINRRHQEILMVFFFLRLIESQALTILCGGKDKRYRIASELLREGLIKAIKISARERTSHQMTLFAITKKGMRYLCEKTSGTVLDHLTDGALRSLAIFGKDEYSTAARKRIADTSSAVIMAITMGGTIPVAVLNRRYTFGRENSPNGYVVEARSCKTFTDFIQTYLSEEEYSKLSCFGRNCLDDDKQICFYDAAYVKQAVSGTNETKAARDFYKGREIGLFASPTRSLLTYFAPFFGMGWSKWQTKPEMSAIISWNQKYAPKEIFYRRQFNALLIVKDSRQFANLYNDVDHARKEDEVFGGRFDHMFIVEHSAYGVKFLQWLLMLTDVEIDDCCTNEVQSRQLGSRNDNPSNIIFRYTDMAGNEGMCGLHLDAKRMLILDRWARRHPDKTYVVYCVEQQMPYYKAIMPQNVSYVLL